MTHMPAWVCQELTLSFDDCSALFERMKRESEYAYYAESELTNTVSFGVAPRFVYEVYTGRVEVRERVGAAYIDLLTKKTTDPISFIFQERERFLESVPYQEGWHGCVGYATYELSALWKSGSCPEVEELDVPLAVFMFFDQWISFDKVKNVGACITQTYSDRYFDVREILPFGGALDGQSCSDCTKEVSVQSDDEFKARIQKVLPIVQQGYVPEIVLDRVYNVHSVEEPWSCFTLLQLCEPECESFFLAFPQMQLCGVSVAAGMHVDQSQMRVQISGGVTGEGLGRKHAATTEHVMLADFGATDLGRVGEYGSFAVNTCMEPLSLSGYDVLTTEVSAQIRKGSTLSDAFKAFHPSVSVTGVFQSGAMRALAQLEGVSRGIHAGAVGYISAHSMHFTSTVRTIVFSDASAHFSIAVPIVADSDPDEKCRESQIQAEGLLRVLDVNQEAV